MSKIKICGLRRDEDIEIVNEAKPDFAGFIIGFPKSFRSIEPSEAARLCAKLDKDIIPVGVFVDMPCEYVAGVQGIQIIQLHGSEDDAYIARLKAMTDKPIIKAYQIKGDLKPHTSADYMLLDSGQGSGQMLNWSTLENIKAPYFLAGGLTPQNILEAIKMLNPYALDISSGVETDKYKDKEKVLAAVKAAHERK